MDGLSTDDTVAVAKSYAPRAKVVMVSTPGKGAALRAGFAACTGDIVVMLDADGSTDPHEIPAFVGLLLSGADVVMGSRFTLGGGTDDMERHRRIGNWALTRLVRLGFGARFSDLCYGYTAFWRDVLPVISGPFRGFEVETVIHIRAVRAGLRIAEVPSFESIRISGTTNLRTVRDGFRVLRAIGTEFGAREGRRHRPPGPDRAPPGPTRAASAVAHQRPLRAPPGAARGWCADPEGRDMSLTPSTLSVVICAYTEERWPDLEAAVASVQRQDLAARDIIVVSDYNDALLERAREAFGGVRVVANSEAKGLSGAANTGITASSGAIVAFLDDDAMAEPGWIRHLLAPYADPLVLGVGGLVVPRWDDARPAWLPEEFDWVVGCTYTGHRSNPGPVRNLIGANMSVRRDVVMKVGGFRHSLGRTESVPAGCEETEFFIRASRAVPERRRLVRAGGRGVPPCAQGSSDRQVLPRPLLRRRHLEDPDLAPGRHRGRPGQRARVHDAGAAACCAPRAGSGGAELGPEGHRPRGDRGDRRRDDGGRVRRGSAARLAALAPEAQRCAGALRHNPGCSGQGELRARARHPDRRRRRGAGARRARSKVGEDLHPRRRAGAQPARADRCAPARARPLRRLRRGAQPRDPRPDRRRGAGDADPPGAEPPARARPAPDRRRHRHAGPAREPRALPRVAPAAPPSRGRDRRRGQRVRRPGDRGPCPRARPRPTRG